MENEKAKSVAFTGYREAKIKNVITRQKLLQELYIAIKKAYSDGCRTFYTGMSDGFDMLAATAVIEFRGEQSDVRLVAVVPFKGQEEKFSSEDKTLYASTLSNADEIITLAEKFEHNDQYLRRNDLLLERSGYLICFYDGKVGGTMYTYNRAVKQGHKIINLHPTANL